ncbi:MAG: hypothetical protein JKY48_18540 [Flavobacteriales bacterium]|nr:hypothetical protein [Flavobacteriales bacterium]
MNNKSSNDLTKKLETLYDEDSKSSAPAIESNLKWKIGKENAQIGITTGGDVQVLFKENENGKTYSVFTKSSNIKGSSSFPENVTIGAQIWYNDYSDFCGSGVVGYKLKSKKKTHNSGPSGKKWHYLIGTFFNSEGKAIGETYTTLGEAFDFSCEGSWSESS